MTAAGVPADEGRRQRGFPDLFAEGDRLVGLTYWEDLLTFVLLAASQTAFALSIANADWVDEMPDLTVAAWAGMLVGVLLARLHTSAGWFAYDPARSALLSRVRWSAWWLFPAGLALGAAVSVAMVMHTMELADPFAMGIEARWSELWARLKDWGAALIFGGVSSDPMPFVLLMVFVTWIVPYLAGWAVFRWRNPWLALVPAGVGILTNISYLPGQPSIAFILFLFAAILLFTRLQLLRTIMRWQGQRAELPQLLSIEVLHAGAWVAVLLILASWIVPTGGELDRVSAGWERVTQPVTDRVDRFGQVFLGIDSKRGNLIHHFDNALPLQGRVKLEDEPMYAVTLAADDELRGEEFLQLRSTAFDEYTRAGWKLSGTERDALPGTTIEAASFGTPETRTQLRRPVVTEIEVIEPLSDRRLLSVGDPLATDIEAELVTGPAGIDLAALQPDERVRAGDRYVTVGTISAANPEVLLGVGTEYPAWVTERYLQLPDSLPERVRELALDIAGDANSAYLAAFQIENYLRNPNNYRFSLKVDDQPPRADPVDYFLFESGEGYFDHYASAMAVMMRSLGYPARVAVGFFVDSQLYDEETGAYVLTEEDSWTWPEVYFPGLGWVEFNPTPGRATVSRPGFAAFGGEDVSVLDIAEGTDETLFIEAGAVGDDVVATPDEQTEAVAEAAARDFTTPLLWLLAAVASLSALYFLVSLAWAFPYRQLAPATQRWAKVQRLSSWAGMSPGEDRTPIETAGTLGRVIEVGEPAHHLARSFTRERYGRAAGADGDDGEVERLDRSYREVRNRLVRLALLRPFRLRRRAPGT